MALEDKLAAAEAAPAKDDSNIDLEIAVLLGQRLLDDGGFDVIEKAVGESSDAAQVVGQFIMQMGTQLMESMPEGTELSPEILLAPGGWVEQMSDYIQEEGVADKTVMDKAEIYVASTAQQMAQQAMQKGDPNAPPVAPGANVAPPMPGGAV
jgi:hypothetical protein